MIYDISDISDIPSNKNYKDFGEIDFQDHELELREEQYEKDRKAAEGDEK